MKSEHRDLKLYNNNNNNNNNNNDNDDDFINAPEGFFRKNLQK